MQWYAMKKLFVAVHGSSRTASLEVLFIVQHCIDTVLCTAFCLKAQPQKSAFECTLLLSDAGKALL